ncbi:MAG TPA: EpsI family protein, partial [candidate division Zixibacteria bacterium]|nr:EpsI family protein [candidate division Zixibacteria bacterium]
MSGGESTPIRRTPLWPALAIILLGGALGLTLRYYQVEPANAPQFAQLPYQFGAYRGAEERFSDETYEILQATETTLRRYQDARGVTYWLFVAYFKDQKYGSQIHSPRHCLPGGGWRIEALQDFPIRADNGFSVDANKLTIERDNHRQLMLYWFETRSGAIHNEFGLKFDLVKNALLFRPTDAAFVRLTVQ